MRHRKTPGCIVDPGPAPGVDPGPMAVAVRRPVGSHAVRDPDLAVTRVVAPVAMGVQVLVADHVRRHITRRDRVVIYAVAGSAPAVEIVRWLRNQVLVIAQAGAAEAVSLARIQQVGRAFSISLTLALAQHDVGGIAVGVHRDPVLTRLAQCKGQVGSVYFHRLVWRQPRHTHIQRAFGQLQLGNTVVQVEHRNAGVGAHADHRTTDL